MSALGAGSRPRDVQLCPALALVGERYCSAHRTAKKLAQVDEGEACRSCDRKLHVGDYVTLGSSAHNNRHAACPKDRPHVQARPKGETPLFDEPAVAARE